MSQRLPSGPLVMSLVAPSWEGTENAVKAPPGVLRDLAVEHRIEPEVAVRTGRDASSGRERERDRDLGDRSGRRSSGSSSPVWPQWQWACPPLVGRLR